MPNLEVLKLMFHLIITLVLIIGYVLLSFIKGDHDPTLQNLLILAVGYWFGAVTLNRGNNDSQNNPLTNNLPVVPVMQVQPAGSVNNDSKQ